MWDQGLRHGPATYYHPNGNKDEATYVEGYEEVSREALRKGMTILCRGSPPCIMPVGRWKKGTTRRQS